MIRALALGAGVQSTTVAELALAGQIPPIDVAIFADTGSEPAAVYAHLERLGRRLRGAGIELIITRRGPRAGSRGQSIAEDLLDSIEGRTPTTAAKNPPLFVDNGPGKRRGIIRRKCTQEYKIRPMERTLRAALELGRSRPKAPLVEQLFGISWDESERVSDPSKKWIVHGYPLLDYRLHGDEVRPRDPFEPGMTRADCLLWLTRNGIPHPERSACTFCPLHDDGEWRRLKVTDAEGWNQAVDFDRRIRDGSRIGLRGELYLHESLRPLDEVDLSNAEDAGQGTLFTGDGCSIVCASDTVRPGFVLIDPPRRRS